MPSCGSCAGLLDSRPLLGEDRVLGIVGSGEVRVDRIDRQVGAGGRPREGSCRGLSCRNPSRFIPVSIFR